jgi:hypothetical protein
MATERQREVVLGGLLVILAVVGYRAWTSQSAAPASTSNARGTARPSARTGAPPASPFDVHLSALDEERPKPEPAERNLFRFKPKPPPPRPVQPIAVGPPVARGPVGPPPPPPITLKFIGIFEQTGRATKIAILSDGTGVALSGKEGDIVAGQYQILKIGAESIEMAYLDGRGRQTIRLTGS